MHNEENIYKHKQKSALNSCRVFFRLLRGGENTYILKNATLTVGLNPSTISSLSPMGPKRRGRRYPGLKQPDSRSLKRRLKRDRRYFHFRQYSQTVPKSLIFGLVKPRRESDKKHEKRKNSATENPDETLAIGRDTPTHTKTKTKTFF